MTALIMAAAVLIGAVTVVTGWGAGSLIVVLLIVVSVDRRHRPS